MSNPEQFTFQVGAIRFSKDGFNIVSTTQGDCVTGKFAARIGHCYKAEGRWEQHPSYGPQFKLDSAVSVQMTTPDALGRFLTLQLKGKGIGETVISSLVEACKDGNLNLEEMLDKNQRDLLIECVGARNAKKIDFLLATWPTIKPAADLMSPLLGYGLSEAMAEAIIVIYGKRAIEQVEDRPYDLILRIDGVSFLTADKIAKKVGIIKTTDPIRLRAALSTGMRDATSNGDIGVRRKTLIDKTLPLVNDSIMDGNKRKLAPGVPLQVTEEMLSDVLNDMIRGVYKDDDGNECGFSSRLVEFPDAKGESVVWYAPLVDAEQLIAERLASFNAVPRPDLVAKIDTVASDLGAVLSPEQRTAIETALMNPVSIITGGPGCGKSFLLKVLLHVMDSVKFRCAQAAPTGKAAKRIQEATGRPAQTQHSLIGFQSVKRCAFNQSLPLVADYVVLDESSMADTELTAATLNAVANKSRVIMVGDVDQLASVGPGQVLRDLIRSHHVPVTRLTKGYRFSGGIAEAARTINSGHVPESSADGQYVQVDTETPAQDLLAAIKKLIADGVDPDHIQVLAPTHKGDAGCTALNKAIQALLNPEPAGGTNQRLRRDSGDLRVGDRVIQTKNDRELGLVNGDVGWIVDISTDKGSVVLCIPDKSDPIKMTSTQAANLKLAYAITVHKSQGAESPYVLLALDRSASFMLRRNLPYTGVTRASKCCMVFSSRSTMMSAVHRGEPAEGSRRTSLVQKLDVVFGGRKLAAPAPVAPRDAIADAMKSGFTDVPF